MEHFLIASLILNVLLAAALIITTSKLPSKPKVQNLAQARTVKSRAFSSSQRRLTEDLRRGIEDSLKATSGPWYMQYPSADAQVDSHSTENDRLRPVRQTITSLVGEVTDEQRLMDILRVCLADGK